MGTQRHAIPLPLAFLSITIIDWTLTGCKVQEFAVGRFWLRLKGLNSFSTQWYHVGEIEEEILPRSAGARGFGRPARTEKEAGSWLEERPCSWRWR